MSKRVRFALWGILFALGAFGIVPWAYALDGAALYGQYCAGCHGPLATSSMLGRSASQIQDAINSVSMMSSLKSLTTAQINAIADALNPAPPPPPPPPPSPPPPAGDKTPPSIAAFSIPPTSDSLTVPIQALAATDNVGVTGYKITESSTPPKASAAGWSSSAPSSYTFTSGGTKTLYAWAKDAAGNVSASVSASVVITLSNPPLPPPPSSGVDMSNWVGQWLKMTIKYEGYAFGTSSGSENGEDSSLTQEEPPQMQMGKDHQEIGVYLKITGWDPQQNVLQTEMYQYDEKSNQWSSDPLTLHFAGGTATDFLCWSQEEGGFTFGFAARVQGRGRQGTLQSGSLKTLGGYYLEMSAGSPGLVGAPDSSGQMAGGLSVSGSLVPASKVPAPK